MVAVTINVERRGKQIPVTVRVPANHTEATSGSVWGVVVAGGLLLLIAGFVCLIVFAA